MTKASSSGLKTVLYVDGRVVYSAALHEGKKYVDEIKGAQVSATEIQKFLFASLELTGTNFSRYMYQLPQIGLKRYTR